VTVELSVKELPNVCHTFLLHFVFPVLLTAEWLCFKRNSGGPLEKINEIDLYAVMCLIYGQSILQIRWHSFRFAILLSFQFVFRCCLVTAVPL
jgi:hypothetical protein